MAAASAGEIAASSHDQVMLGLVALSTALLGLLGWLLKAKLSDIATDAAQVNAAVNHKETGELSLYRLADSNNKKLDEVLAKQAEFDKSWGNLPAGLDDAVGLVGMLHGMDARITAVHNDLLDHVKWEMEAKYQTKTGETP